MNELETFTVEKCLICVHGKKNRCFSLQKIMIIENKIFDNLFQITQCFKKIHLFLETAKINLIFGI